MLSESVRRGTREGRCETGVAQILPRGLVTAPASPLMPLILSFLCSDQRKHIN